jgi:uracil phosphoribosyltransferase
MSRASEESKRAAATGGSAMKAVEVIMDHGVPEDRIIFVNLVRALVHNAHLS